MHEMLLRQLKSAGKQIGLHIIFNALRKRAPIWFFYLKSAFLPKYGSRRELRLSGKSTIYDIFACRANQYIGMVGRYDRFRDPHQLFCVFGSGIKVSALLIDDLEHEIEGKQVLLALFLIPDADIGKNHVTVTLGLGPHIFASNIQIPLNALRDKNLLSVTTLMKDEDRFLPEWIAYYRLLGASHFYIYDNRSLKRREIRQALDSLIKEGVVTLIDWDYPYESGALDNSWRFCQRGQMHHCLYKYGDNSKWMLFIDVDEFIFPVEENSLIPLLQRYETDSSVAALQFKMIWFGNSGFSSVPDGLVIENYTHRARNILENGREKCAVKPQFTQVLFIHGVKRSSEGSEVIAVSPDKYRINHYYATSSKRQNKGSADHNEIVDLGMNKFIEAVKTRLYQS